MNGEMIHPYYLLDTNIISEVLKTKPDEHVRKNFLKYEKLCALPATTWNELLFGVQSMAMGKKHDFLLDKLVNSIQSRYDIIHYDNHAAWIQADIRARLKEAGKTGDFQDTQIAAIAVANGMILVTRNVKRFEPIQAVSPLLVENWF